MRQEYIHLRDHVVGGLRSIPGITCTKPEGAFYAYPNISSFLGRGGLKSASDVAGRLLREAYVATVPGEGFGTSEHIRVSYATSKAELDRGLNACGNCLPRCSRWKSFSPQRALGKRIWVRQRPFRLRAVFLF